MRGGQVMSALDFVKSDDTSDVAFTDAEAAAGDDAVVRGSKHRFEDTGYVSVPNVKGFTKTTSPKTSTRRSARCMLKGASQSNSSSHVDLSDDIKVSRDQGPSVDAKKEKNLIVLGKKKSAGKKSMVTSVQGSPRKDIESLSEDEIYVPNSGVGELTRRHEIEIGDLKKKMDADNLQLKADREALDVQKKAFAEEKEGLKASVVQLLHLGLVVGFKLHESGQALEQSPLFRLEASEIFKESVHKLERLTYPYVSEVSSCFGKPLSMLQGLKSAGLNEKVCSKVLESLYKKRSRSGDSEETFSDDVDVSKDASLEGSAIAGDGGQKAKKAKKAKKDKGNGTGASKPSSDV
ncbi:hypothetical protein Hdeb2414_s0004g00132821 [Helianthus debilis subsp. tardiflorus]